MDNDWVYYVQSVTRGDVMSARKEQYDKLMDRARERFWNHCDEHFADCCRKMLIWLDRRVRELVDSEKRRQLGYGTALYAPWQYFYGESKVFAFIRFEKQQQLSLFGQFAGSTLFGTIIVDIRKFNSCQAFLQWTESIDDAVAQFVSKMREQRCEEYEKLLHLPF